MDEFGLPRRSATSDANEGIVNPPARRRTASQLSATRKPETNLDEGVQNFGAALGSALEKRLDETATSINERRAVTAAARQGQEQAVNSVDSNKKRHGWEKAVFGENVEYRAAQQRAVENTVQAAYLEQATRLDEFAGETPEEYEIRLQKGLETAIEPHKGDKDTVSKITNAWLTASGKLAAKQYESHYAHNQNQQRETYSVRVQQTFDTFTVDASLASTPEESAGVMMSAKIFFDGGTKPEGMNDIAWKSVVNEQLSHSLKEGNIGAYNAAKAAGWLDKISPAEKASLDRAVAAYDSDFSRQVSLAYENAELAALEAPNLDAASAIYGDLRRSLDNLEGRSSGTDTAQLALTRGHQFGQKGINSIMKAKAKIAENAAKVTQKAYEKAQENEQKLLRLETLKEALRTEDPITRSGTITEVDPKRSELEDALDTTIVEDASAFLGSKELLSPADATKALLENPELAKKVAKRLVVQEVDSPLVKRAVESLLGGFTGLANEDGQINLQGIAALQSVGQFAEDTNYFKDLVGSSNFDRYEIIRRGLSVGQTVEMITKDLDEYTSNRGNKSIYGDQWQLGKGESKRDRIRSLVSRFANEDPTNSSVSHYAEEYDRALTIYKGDRKAAEDYLRTSVQSAGLNYRGRVIPHGKQLNTITDYNFDQLMAGVEKSTGNSASLLTPYLATLVGRVEDDDGKPITNIDQLKDVEIKVKDGISGFFLDSREAQAEVHITEEVMRSWERSLKQRDNFQKLKKKADSKIYEQWLQEIKQVQGYG